MTVTGPNGGIAKPYCPKAVFAMILAGTACLALGPIAAGIAFATRVEDGRSLFFLQARVGRGRRSFTMIKFRSMSGERVIRVGRLLRRTGLDELPRFINI